MERTVKKGKADESRERILDAAAKLFRKNGYAAMSLRAIAAEAGMKAGSVYYHFDSKEQIVIEVLNLGIEVVHQGVENAVNALPPHASAGEIVRTGILAHLKALFQFSDYTSANVRIYGQVPSSAQKANLFTRRRYEALWDSILERAAAKGGVRAEVNRKAFRLMIIGSLNATLEWFRPKRGEVDALADQYAAILLNGLLENAEVGNGPA